MDVILLTEDEYNHVLMETFTVPNEQIEVSVNVPPHPLTNDSELNSKICRSRLVRFKRVGEQGSNEWEPLTAIYKISFASD